MAGERQQFIDAVREEHVKVVAGRLALPPRWSSEAARAATVPIGGTLDEIAASE